MESTDKKKRKKKKKDHHLSVPTLDTLPTLRGDETGSDMSIVSQTSPTSGKNMEVTPNDLTSLSSPNLLLHSGWTPVTESTVRRASSATEKMIFNDYKDGVMNQNRRPFDGVTFCFRCDKKHDDILRRCRSASSIDSVLGPLVKRVEKTGEKFRDGCMIPVYRTVFLCRECVAEVDSLKENHKTTPHLIESSAPTIRITSQALNFF